MAVARLALREHRAGGDIQGGKQSGGAVADVIMGDALDIAMSRTFSIKKGSVESLKLRLRWGCKANA